MAAPETGAPGTALETAAQAQLAQSTDAGANRIHAGNDRAPVVTGV